MLNMHRQVYFVFVIHLLNYTKCFQFYYWTNETDGYLNTSSTEITEQQITKESFVIGLEINKIKDEELNEVEKVENFPELELFKIQTGQDFLPILTDLPKIKSIEMTLNNFIYVKRESLSDLPVEVVILSFNQIIRIEKGSFGKKVRYVELLCNNLTTINTNWFQNLSSLEEIHLGGNFLTKIQPNLFKPMKNLKDIGLSYNDIVSIGEEAFGNRDDFAFLNLQYNHLEELKPNIFGFKKVKIGHLKINNNNLTFLSTELLGKMSIINDVSLSDNPWQCKCWFVIKQWLSDEVIIKRDQTRPVCVASLSFSEYCVPFIDKELIEHYSANLDLPEFSRSLYCGKN